MTRVVSATEFKAKCSAILSDIEQHGKPITITKRGHPVAVLGPAKKKKVSKTLKGDWAGKIIEVEDLAKVDLFHLYDRISDKREP